MYYYIYMDKKIPKKVGLALGGGGAKGLAHIGVIRALEKAGIEISYIAGTSMGALIGGWYAATKDIHFLENVFLRIKDKRDMTPVSRLIRKKDKDLFKDKTIISLLEERIHNFKIEDCKIPFTAVATDVENGEEVDISSGNLLEAIHASTALPLVFPPIKQNERLLMDGGFVNPVPADVVRSMGAEFVIAVDVSSKWYNIEETQLGPMHIYSVIPKMLSVIEYQIARRVLKEADVVLAPPVLGFKWFDFQETLEIIRCGENETKNKMYEIYKGSGYSEPEKTAFEKFIDFILYQD